MGIWRSRPLDLLPDEILEQCMLATQSEVTVRTWAQVNRQAATCARRVLARAQFPPTRLILRCVGYCKPIAGKARLRPRPSSFHLGHYDYNLVMGRGLNPQLDVGIQFEGHLDNFALIRGRIYLESHTGFERLGQTLGPVLLTGHNPLQCLSFDLQGYTAYEDLYIVELYLEVIVEGTDYADYLRYRLPQTQPKLFL